MRSYFSYFAAFVLIVAPVFLTGCGSGAAVPAGSSAASEAADAAGGMNRTDTPGAPKGDAPAADAPKADAPAADAPKGDAPAAPAGGDKKPE